MVLFDEVKDNLLTSDALTNEFFPILSQATFLSGPAHPDSGGHELRCAYRAAAGISTAVVQYRPPGGDAQHLQHGSLVWLRLRSGAGDIHAVHQVCVYVMCVAVCVMCVRR